VARSPLHVLLFAACLLAVASGLTAYTQLRRSLPEPESSRQAVRISPRPSALPLRPPRAPRPAPVRPSGHLVARVRPGFTLALHGRPFGRVVRRLDGWTEFGSPRALSVVRTVRGRWLGVMTPELGNGRLAWIDARARAVTYARTTLKLEVDLSRRELVVRSGSRISRRIRVGVGRTESPTPTGRFFITDKLRGPDYSSAYGCCILALSGRQPNLPPGWTGGDRLAIHGTANPGGIGGRVSAGCLHASTDDLRSLMRSVPLGTPVLIRA
jgi:L,D-transpeptidase catalytic domain